MKGAVSCKNRCSRLWSQCQPRPAEDGDDQEKRKTWGGSITAGDMSQSAVAATAFGIRHGFVAEEWPSILGRFRCIGGSLQVQGDLS